MKNALMVPLVFIAHILLWSLSIALFSVLSSWTALQVLPEGKYLPLIIESLWAILRYAPFILSVSLVGVFFFLMRHSSLLFISIPLALVLAAASVVFVIPASYAGLDRISDAHKDVARIDGLLKGRLFQPGYIRPDSVASRMIWFVSAATGDSVSPLITVGSSASSGTDPRLSVYRQAYFFRDSSNLVVNGKVVVDRASGDDPLSARNVAVPRYFDRLPSRIDIVLGSFQSAYEKQWFSYLVLAGAFFAAVTALFFLCFAADWRLLNVVLVMAVCLGLYLGFPYTVSGPAFDTVRKFLPASLAPGLMTPLAYLAFSSLVLLCGTAVWIRRAVRRHFPGRRGS
jgi:hypothetical protein